MKIQKVENDVDVHKKKWYMILIAFIVAGKAC